MTTWTRWAPPLAVLAGALAAGCMAGAPAPHPPAAAAPQSSGPLGSPFAERHGLASSLATPLIIDRTDMRLGTTAQFDRIPNPAELNDLEHLPSLAHVVVSLAAWPADFEPLKALGGLPETADLIVVLPGYPPSRAAAEAWNYVNVHARLVVVVDGPPPSPTVINDLNTMLYLERVIVQMDEPSRSGFDRLQRPLSFRKLVE